MYGRRKVRRAGGGPVRYRRGGRTQYNTGGRVFNPLDEDMYETYGVLGGEHLFFDGQLPGPGGSGGGGSSAATGSAPTIEAGAATDEAMQAALDQLAARGIPVERMPGSRIYEPPELIGGQGIDFPGGGSGGALDALTGMIDPTPGPGDVQSPGARVSDLGGSQYQVNNPMRRYDPTGHIMPDHLGINNPFSVVGRAYSQPLHLVDPYTMMNPRQQLGLGISGAPGTDHFNLMQHLAFLADTGYA